MDSGSRKHAARACTECKEKKIRCLPNNKTPGVCQRCARFGKECTVPEIREQPHRRKLLNRVGQLEKNMDGIVAMLADQRSPAAMAEGDHLTPTPASTSSVTTSPSATTLSNDLRRDVIDTGLVTIEQAETFVRDFRGMSIHFPYVLISPHTSLSDLRNESPVLLQAIFATTSWRNRSLQIALERNFLRDLSTRLLMEGQKSLDLLQGLLVYVAWYHFHISPSMQQCYRLTALAVAIAVDLGLNRRPRKSEKQKMCIESHALFAQGLTPAGPDFWNREARRAFIGCYALSSSYSLTLRKTSPLKFTDYIQDCASSLEAERQVPSDAMIVHYIRLMRHADEVCETFGYNDSDQSQMMSEEKIHLYVNSFGAKLESIKANQPLTFSQEPHCVIRYHLLQIYTHEIGLHENLQTSSPSVHRTAILYDCLIHAKSYFEAVLALSREDMYSWTTRQWAWLNYVIKLVSRVSLCADSPAWNINVAQSVMRLDAFLEPLCVRLKELCALISLVEGASSWYHNLMVQWEIAKSHYQADSIRQTTELSRAAQGRPRDEGLSTPGMNAFSNTSSATLTSFDSIDFGDDGFWMPSNLNPWSMGGM
ncbi:MAG: hypothetical protein M1819_000635 [Sarea resinae]|nr:MAG: hypothetical protein M1819_000635 [Sarea resinae]